MLTQIHPAVVNRFGRFVKALEVCGEKRDAATMHAHSLPYPVSENKTRVEYRHQLSAMFAGASRREFDLLLVWSLDRFSREGMAATVVHLQRLTSHGVAFRSYIEEHLSTENELVRNILLAPFALISLPRIFYDELDPGVFNHLGFLFLGLAPLAYLSWTPSSHPATASRSLTATAM